MRDVLVKALTWALTVKPDPAMMKWPAAVLAAACFGLLLFAIFQYQTSERRWGMKLLLGLLGAAVVVGLGAAAFHWLTGVLYGVGYLLTWLAWALTGRWSWWRQALARGLTAGLTLGPWLWLGATERSFVNEDALVAAARLLAPSGVIWFWMLLGTLWILVLVGGWDCWRWPLARPGRRRWLVATWAVLGLLGLNWYAAGRVDLFAACEYGQGAWRLAYGLASRPGSQWYRDADGETPLHRAAARANIEAIRLLLATGAEVHARARSGRTPLHGTAGCWFGPSSVEALRVLLAAGADVNAKDEEGTTPLHAPIVQDNTVAIRWLLAAGADANAKNDLGETPLCLAVTRGRVEAIRLLLAAGADANTRDKYGRTPLRFALDGTYYNIEMIRLLLAAGADVKAQTDYGETPLWAALEGGVGAVRLLLAAGADVNTTNDHGSTPLHYASQRDQPEAMRLLLDAGAGVEVKDRDGRTPLHHAGGPEPIRLLLAAGADVNAKSSYDERPLHFVAFHALGAEAVRLLIQAGAQLKAEDDGGETPLHSAAWGWGRDIDLDPEPFCGRDAETLAADRIATLRVLLDIGAEVNAKRHDGQTPLHRASAWGWLDVLPVLLAAGARVNERDAEGRTPLDLARNDECRKLLRDAGGKRGKDLDAEPPAPAK